MYASGLSSPIRTVTGSTFAAEVLNASGRIAVEFMSYGCGHCRTIAPVLEQVAEMVHADETVLRVNVGVDQDLASTYGIEATPTFVMFRNGHEAGRVEGPDPNVASVLAAITDAFA